MVAPSRARQFFLKLGGLTGRRFVALHGAEVAISEQSQVRREAGREGRSSGSAASGKSYLSR